LAADTAEAFVYDRIMTDLDHHRKGLGRALMTALCATRRYSTLPELRHGTGWPGIVSDLGMGNFVDLFDGIDPDGVIAAPGG
jgi:hypothetical protein